jgi:hypothetical protein
VFGGRGAASQQPASHSATPTRIVPVEVHTALDLERALRQAVGD